MLFKQFSTLLHGTLEATDTSLPLHTRDQAALLELIPRDEEMFLLLEDGTYKENIRAYNVDGYILIERGIDSVARKFPRGTCVRFDLTLPLVKWLICNYDCCEGDCPCDPVQISGTFLPDAKVGTPWSGFISFSGTLPMNLSIVGAPAWVHITYGATAIQLTGTPTSAGSYTVAAAATNCNGASFAQQQIPLTVAA